MSSLETVTEEPPVEPADGIVADSLANGVAFMLALTVVQRTVGFVRNVMICRLMEPADLGCWNLSYSFLVLAAPLVILGVPGMFSRYVEHFRQRSQLHGFLRQATLATALLAFAGIGAVLLFRKQISWLAYGSTEMTELLLVSTATLVFVIVYNYFVELLTALRQVKWNSYIQFFNSVVFTLLAVVLLATTELGAQAVLWSYLLACLFAAILAYVVSRRTLQPVAGDETKLSSRAMWVRVGPFIGWFCLSDLMVNLFNSVDRLMIVHCARLGAEQAQAMVGQYHSSRIIGVLLIAITGMLSTLLLSYLSHDWESNRKDEAQNQLDMSLRLLGLSLTAIGVGVLVFAPLIFAWALDGKYTEGFNVLPATMSYCIWFGLYTVAVNYIFFHEKPGLACAALLVALFLNVLLNFLFLPIWGLSGAVMATAVSNFALLSIACLICHRLGMRYQLGTLVAMAMPAVLCLGVLPASAALVAITWHGVLRRWLFSSAEQEEINTLVSSYLQRLPWFRQFGTANT